MNKVYRIIWNATLGKWVVTSELGKSRVKSGRSKVLAGIILSASLMSFSTTGYTSTIDYQLVNNRLATAPTIISEKVVSIFNDYSHYIDHSTASPSAYAHYLVDIEAAAEVEEIVPLFIENEEEVSLDGNKTVTTVNLKTGGILDLGDQQLSIEEGGSVFSGDLRSNASGSLLFINGTTVFNEIHENYKAEKTIISASTTTTVRLNELNALGATEFNLSSLGILQLAGQGEFLGGIHGSGKVIVSESGDVTLLEKNTSFEGDFTIDQGGKLTVTDVEQIKHQSNKIFNLIDIAGTLKLAGIEGQLLNQLTGDGIINLSESTVLNLTNNLSEFNGIFTIDDDSSIHTDIGTEDYVLDLNLAGNGKFVVTSSGSLFSLGNSTVNDFIGDFELDGETIFVLTSEQVTKLVNAGLIVNQGSSLHFDASYQGEKLGRVTFEEGANLRIDSKDQFTQALKVGELIVKGETTIHVGNGVLGSNVDLSNISKNGSFLDQQNGIVGDTIITADSVVGNSAIILKDSAGKVIETGPQIIEAIEDGSGIAFYGFKGAAVTKEGIQTSYGLTALESLTAITLENTGNENEFSAELKGMGKFIIKATGNGLIISGANNSYTGDTVVESGKLILGTDNALGETGDGKLIVNKDAQVDFGGYEQTVEGVVSEVGSQINLKNGTLIVNGSSSISGNIDGKADGMLQINQGNFHVKTSNATFAAETNIAKGAYATLDFADSLGEADITANGQLDLNGKGEFNNTVSGSGIIEIQSDADITLNNANIDFNGTFIVDLEAKTTINDIKAVGTGRVSNQGQLVFGDLGQGLTGKEEFTNSFDGVGEFTVGNNEITVTAAHPAFIGSVNLNETTSKWTIKHDSDGDYASKYTVSGEGTIVVDLNNRDALFSLRKDTNKDDFKGKLVVDSGTIKINDQHIEQLQNSSLVLNREATGEVESETKVAALSLNGGVLKLTNKDTDTIHHLNVGTLHVESGSKVMVMDANAIDIDVSTDDINTDDSYFKQQMGVEGGQIVSADILTGKGASLQLVDSNYEKIESLKGISKNLSDGSGIAHYDFKGLTVGDGISIAYGLIGLEANVGEVIAIEKTVDDIDANLGIELLGEGSFTIKSDDQGMIIGNSNSNYQGETNFESGLVIAGSDNAFGNTSNLVMTNDAYYDLNGKNQTVGKLEAADNTTVDINKGNLTILDGGNINGVLKGDGTLVVDSQNGGELTINGAQNDYHSNTHVLEKGVVNLNDYAGLGDGGIENDGTININVDSNGNFANNLTGKESGEVNFNGDGTVKIDGDNSGYYGDINVGKNAGVIVSNENALGKGQNINNDGSLSLQDMDTTLSQSLTGDGHIEIDHSEITLIGDNNQYTGSLNIDEDSILTTIDQGIIQGDIANTGTWNHSGNSDVDYKGSMSGSGDFIKDGLGTLTMKNDHANFDGNTIINNGFIVTETGSHYGSGQGNLTIKQGGMIIGDTANLNAKEINVVGGKLLIGQDALVSSDKITVSETGIIGGYGVVSSDLTLKGHLDVGSRVDESEHFGVFTVDGDFVATQGSSIHFGTTFAGDNSATDQLIIHGDASGQSMVVVDNVHGLGAKTDKGIQLVRVDGDNTLTLSHKGRTVGGVYEYALMQGTDGNWYLNSSLGQGIDMNTGWTELDAWNLWNNMNNADNTQRYRAEIGAYLSGLSAANNLFNHSAHDRRYTDEKSTVWTRINGGYESFNNSTNQSRTSNKHYSMQIGNDFFRHQLGEYTLKIGGMLGYGKGDSTTRSNVTNYRAKADGDGYSIGAYATFGNLDRSYIDGSLQYIHYKNDIKGSYLANESVKTKGFLASIEAGYSFDFNEIFFVQPQVQMTWMGAEMDDHREWNGTLVRGSKDNVQLRIGTRIFGELGQQNSANMIKPYLELNYIHNTKANYIEMDSVRVSQSGARNIAQMKLGVDASFNANTSVWGDVSHSQGSSSYKDTKVSLGLKYAF